jgi:LAO/AO transport system kinase
MQDLLEIVERLFAGDRGALARLISWAENRDSRFPAALGQIYPRVGRAWRIGITGPPGAGKSSLTNGLVQAVRARDETIAVLAIDPSSPFTGGALLGDRIRMEERTEDKGVYIRSMATRESHGGLARASSDACDVMDAFGFDRIVVETVGVGQAEYDVMGAADTVVVVLCPGAGDGIQAMKAGLLEVADVLCVNKSDLDGADRLILDLEDALRLRRPRDPAAARTPPVVATSAHEAEGLDDLLEAIDSHRRHLERGEVEDLEKIRRGKRIAQVRRVVGERLEEELWSSSGYTATVDSLLEKSITPYDVAEEILGSVLGVSPKTP